MKKIITSIFILMFYLGCSPSQKDVLFANASDEQIIEWGKQYVIHSIEDSLKLQNNGMDFGRKKDKYSC